MFILLLTLACLLLLRLPMVLHVGSFRDMCKWDTFSHRLFFRWVVEEGGHLSRVRASRYLLDAGRARPLPYQLGYYALLHGLGMTAKAFDRFGHLLPTLWDALLIVATAAAMRHFGAVEMRWLLFLPFQQIFTFRISRACHHSERAFGAFLTNLFILSAIGIVREGWEPVWIVLGVSSVILATVSTKFSWQMLLLLTAISSLLLLHPLPLLWLFLCITASIVFTGGYAWHVLRGLLSHIDLCRKALQRQENGVVLHSSTSLLELFLLAHRRQWRNLARQSYENVVLTIILMMPLIIPAAAALLHAQTLDDVTVWPVAGVIVVLLVSLKPFACIGKPERYIEGVTLPLLLWLSTIPFSSVHPFVFWIAVFLSAFATILSTAAAFWIYGAPLRQQGADEAAAIDFLRCQKHPADPPVLLTIPLWFSRKIHLSTTAFDFLSFIGGVARSRHTELLSLQWNWEGAVHPDLHGVVDRYGVQYLVIDRRFEQSLNQRYGRPFYPSKPGTVIFENSSIEIRSIASGTDATEARMEQPRDSW